MRRISDRKIEPIDIWKVATALHGRLVSEITKDDMLNIGWDEFEPDEIRILNNIPGVYILLNGDGHMDYVGISSSVGTRLSNNHHVFDKNRHTVLFTNIVSDRERHAVEHVLIRIYKPPMNKSKGTLCGVLGNKPRKMYFGGSNGMGKD